MFFDTCVYYGKGLQLLTDTVPTGNILFASEMIGAVRGVDPETGRRFDDTKFLVDSIPSLDDAQRDAIYSGNALRVFGRLARVLQARKAITA